MIADTASVSPDGGERERAFEKYAGQLDGTVDHFWVTPELFVRTGAIALAALLLIPLAGLANARRWAAWVVGGSFAVFVVCLVPWVFTPFSDVVSLSQSRRLAGFVPLTFALAGGMGVLARLLGPFVVPVALAAGIAFQLFHPGDFGYTLEHGGPEWATIAGVAGTAAALVLGLVRRLRLEQTAALASCLLLLPTYVHGIANWSPSASRSPNIFSEGLLDAVREHVPAGAVVFSSPEPSYRLGAYVPVRVCLNPKNHVADTVENRPRERVRTYLRFRLTGDLSIPRACGAQWLLVDRERLGFEPKLRPVYRDAVDPVPAVAPRHASRESPALRARQRALGDRESSASASTSRTPLLPSRCPGGQRQPADRADDAPARLSSQPSASPSSRSRRARLHVPRPGRRTIAMQRTPKGSGTPIACKRCSSRIARRPTRESVVPAISAATRRSRASPSRSARKRRLRFLTSQNIG